MDICATCNAFSRIIVTNNKNNLVDKFDLDLFTKKLWIFVQLVIKHNLRIIVTNKKNNLDNKFDPRFLRRDGGRSCEIGITMQMQRGA